eukprot:Trichotokara_eunicae@DN865_c0_g1_i3.p1
MWSSTPMRGGAESMLSHPPVFWNGETHQEEVSGGGTLGSSYQEIKKEHPTGGYYGDPFAWTATSVEGGADRDIGGPVGDFKDVQTVHNTNNLLLLQDDENEDEGDSLVDDIVYEEKMNGGELLKLLQQKQQKHILQTKKKKKKKKKVLCVD